MPHVVRPRTLHRQAPDHVGERASHLKRGWRCRIVNRLTYWAYDNATHIGISNVLHDFRISLGLKSSLFGYKTVMQEQLV